MSGVSQLVCALSLYRVCDATKLNNCCIYAHLAPIDASYCTNNRSEIDKRTIVELSAVLVTTILRAMTTMSRNCLHRAAGLADGGRTQWVLGIQKVLYPLLFNLYPLIQVSRTKLKWNYSRLFSNFCNSNLQWVSPLCWTQAVIQMSLRSDERMTWGKQLHHSNAINYVHLGSVLTSDFLLIFSSFFLTYYAVFY